MGPTVSYTLWVVMCQYRFISYNKWIILVGDVYNKKDIQIEGWIFIGFFLFNLDF